MKKSGYLLSALVVFLLVAIHGVQGRTWGTTTRQDDRPGPMGSLYSKSMLPPMPIMDGSTCSYQYWRRPEYICHWKVVSPEMKVGEVFGPKAAQQYGPDTTLWAGLQGGGDPLSALLREAITAILNAYNFFGGFPYNSLQVVDHLNSALSPPTDTRSLLTTAFDFNEANSGNAHASCKLTTC